MEHKPYLMVFDMEHSIDGIEFDSFEAAKCDAEDTYVLWLTEEYRNWKWDDELHKPNPTLKQIEDFNHMIDNCCCYICKWDEKKGEYEDVDDAYFIPDDELEQLGWKEWKGE